MSDSQDKDTPDTEADAEADPEAGTETVLADIPEDGDMEDEEQSWADMLPTWNPHSTKYGIFQDGVVGVMVGHKGSGKSRTMTKLCWLYRKFIDRAMVVSTTDMRSGQFSDSGLIHPAYILEEPSEQDVLYVAAERREEMRMWRRYRDTGYRQRTLLYLMDDAGYAGRVLGRRSQDMLNLFISARHMRLHMYIALQSMGLLNKQMRLNVDLTFIVREHNGEAMAAMYDSLFKYNTEISASVFREMMDDVCIKGKRIMVWDNRHGRLFKYDLDFDVIRLRKPLGNRAWLRWGDIHLRDEHDEERPEDTLERLARERWEPPAKTRNKRK